MVKGQFARAASIDVVLPHREQMDHYESYTKLRALKVPILVVFLIIPFFQRPLWCSRGEYEATQCAGTRGEHVSLSNVPILPDRLIVSMDVLCILFFVGYKYFKTRHVFPSSMKKLRHNAIYGLSAFTVVSLLTQYFVWAEMFVAAFTKPVFFYLLNRKVRTTSNLFLRITWESRQVIFLLCINIFVFSVLAKILYKGEEEETLYFSSFSEAFYNLLVAQTTNNFPDIILPGYRRNRFNALFYLSFMFITVFILVNLLIAFVYSNYTHLMQNETKKLEEEEKVIIKFNEIMREGHDEDEDYDHDELPSSLSGSNSEITSSLLPKDSSDEKELTKQRKLQFTSKRPLKKFLAHPACDITMGLLSGISFCCVVYMNTPYSHIHGPHFMVTLGQILLNVPLFIETTLHFFAFKFGEGRSGFIQFWEFFTLGFGLILLFMIQFDVIEYKVISFVVELLMFARVFRFLRLLMYNRMFKILFMTLYNLAPFFGDLFVNLFMILYFYALLGVFSFGGKIRSNTIEQTSLAATPDYVYMNFNDFAMSMVTLFEAFVTSNFNLATPMLDVTMNKLYTRVFFVSFYLFGGLMTINILLSIVIDTLLLHFEAVGKERSKQLKLKRRVTSGYELQSSGVSPSRSGPGTPRKQTE